MDSKKLQNALLLLGIAVAVVWLGQFLWDLGGQFGTAILIFLLAWIVSFAVSPAVRRLERAKLPRFPAAILVYLALAGAGVAAALFVVPLVLNDLAGIAARIGDYGDDVQRLTGDLMQWLEGIDIPESARIGDQGNNVQRLTDDLMRWLESIGIPESALRDALGDLGSNFTDLGATAVSGLIGALTGIATATLIFFMTLIVSFYLVLDWDRWLTRFEKSLPGVWGAELRRAVHTIEVTFTGFLRGQLAESALYGLVVAIVMLIAGLDYVIVVAIFSGLVLVIPFVGPIVGVLVPVLVALLTSPVVALWVGVPLLLLQLVLENVVKPRIIGGAVGIHPLVVIASVLVGTAAAGFWGAVFGIPFGALVYFAIRAAYTRWVSVAGKTETDIPPPGPKPEEQPEEAPGVTTTAAGGRGQVKQKVQT